MSKKIQIIGPDYSGSISQESIDSFMKTIGELLRDHPVTVISMSDVDHRSDFIGLPTWKLGEDDFPLDSIAAMQSVPELEHSIMSKQYEKYEIVAHEIDYIKYIITKWGASSIDDFMKIHEAKFDGNFEANHTRNVLKSRHERFLSRQPKVCDCGAKHTSFPNHHYHWCKTKEV
jgi:hypothetical protein